MSIFQNMGQRAAGGVRDWFSPGEMTYEEMLRRRQIAQAAQTRQRDMSAPGAGFGALADAFVGKIAGGQADAATTKGREGASSALGALLQGRIGGGGMSAPQMNLLPPQQATSGGQMQPQIAPDGSIQRGGMADTIRQGLAQRGLPPHVADAFVMNMQDESGLNPGINEAKPLVPGSRGGFGLAQWTGGRRRQLEQFAAQQGKPVSDPDVQMDFLVSELQGSERGAAQAILSAPDTGSAAAAIVNKFLRPAEEHRARRVAQYTGGQQSDASPGAMSFAGGSEPNVQFTSQMGGSEGIDPRLAELMQNPYVAELPQAQQGALAALFQQQLGQAYPEQMTPYQQAQVGLQRDQFDWQREQAMQPGNNQTEYGLNPQTGVDENGNPVLIQIGKNGEAIQTQMPEGVSLSKEPIRIDAGTEWVLLDPITRQPIANIPKNNQEAAAETARGRVEGEAQAGAVLGLPGAVSTASRAIANLEAIRDDPALPGITGMVQGRLPPMSQAGTDLNTRIQQAQGQAFLEAFESLKGGGAITEIEGTKAEQAMARLNRAQSTEAYQQALNDLIGVLNSGVARAQQMAQQAGGAPVTAPPPPPESVMPPAAVQGAPDFSTMSDEELQQWLAQNG